MKKKSLKKNINKLLLVSKHSTQKKCTRDVIWVECILQIPIAINNARGLALNTD